MKKLSFLITIIVMAACTNVQNNQSIITEQPIIASMTTSPSETPTLTLAPTQTETLTLTSSPTQTEIPTATFTPSPTFLPLAGWTTNKKITKAISFQYHFPPNFWTVGKHKTELVVDCTGSLSEMNTTWSEYLTVKEDAPILKDVVQFRIGGIKVITDTGKKNVTAINPAQPTVATIDMLLGADSDIDGFLNSCKLTFNWDDQEPVDLIAGPLIQREK